MKISSPIPKRRSRIVIIPLIDIMFFLLASFMMISLQMSRTADIRVNLPSATQARQDYKPGMVNIAIDVRRGLVGEKNDYTAGIQPGLERPFSQRHRSAGLYQRETATPCMATW